jgi:5-formyltetrahydrofolate cyclo-ligase
VHVTVDAPRIATARTRRSLSSLLMSSAATGTAADGIQSRKRDLRKEIRGKLKALPRAEIAQQSGAVWDRLQELAVYQQAQSIGLFLSMPAGEIDTDPALRHAVHAGKDIYVPQVGANFECADMELIKVQTKSSSSSSSSVGHELFHHSWPRNKWGIPEPPPDMMLETAAVGEIDVLIVPGLAFDRLGNRLGQGKGYYDRYMARMSAAADAKPPVLIGVGMECQCLDLGKIPVHEHDFAVQWVLLPNETIRVNEE